jgi:hypothetical protein
VTQDVMVLAKAGLPAVVMFSEVFKGAVERLATGKGVPELPRQIYHIDFEFYPDEQLIQTVRDTVPEMVAKLTHAESEAVEADAPGQAAR